MVVNVVDRPQIVPHGLSFNGYRWHARAWCYQRQKFLDFVIARVIDVLNTRAEEVDANQDCAWHSMVKVRLGPNLNLTSAQQEAICLDYGT